jgi:hypothetical protein
MSYCWHAYLGLPWAKDPLNPLLVDLERAKSGLQMREQRKYRASHLAEAEE